MTSVLKPESSLMVTVILPSPPSSVVGVTTWWVPAPGSVSHVGAPGLLSPRRGSLRCVGDVWIICKSKLIVFLLLFLCRISRVIGTLAILYSKAVYPSSFVRCTVQCTLLLFSPANGFPFKYKLHDDQSTAQCWVANCKVWKFSLLGLTPVNIVVISLRDLSNFVASYCIGIQIPTDWAHYTLLSVAVNYSRDMLLHESVCSCLVKVYVLLMVLITSSSTIISLRAGDKSEIWHKTRYLLSREKSFHYIVLWLRSF